MPILREVGKQPVIRAAIECLTDTIYGQHSTLPEYGIATLDDFLMMALPKIRRPIDMLDQISRLDSGHAIVAGMKSVFNDEIKKRNL